MEMRSFRLGEPAQGHRRVLSACVQVVHYYGRVVRRAWIDAWVWAHGQGLIVATAVGVVVAVADGVGEKHVPVAHLILAALAGFGAAMAILLVANVILAPVKLDQEGSPRPVASSGAAVTPPPNTVIVVGDPEQAATLLAHIGKLEGAGPARPFFLGSASDGPTVDGRAEAETADNQGDDATQPEA